MEVVPRRGVYEHCAVVFCERSWDLNRFWRKEVMDMNLGIGV